MLFIVGCSSTNTPPQPLPTLVRFPTITPTLPVLTSPTVIALPSQTMTATSTATLAMTATARLQVFATDTITPTMQATITPTATALPTQFIFGQSVAGRDLVAYRYGTGQYIIMLVGGIHAGFEANTVDLLSQLQQYFQNNPTAIDPNMSFIIIPSLNPDGATRGRNLEGRFNANRVDLNRNWGCGWSPDAVFRDIPVDAGDRAFSEPETTALGSLIQRVQPVAVIFYHAAANGVFAGNCDDNTTDSEALAAIYGEASGYPYGVGFGDYEVTGTAPGWVDSIGILALDVELATADTAEFNRNLRAIERIQTWLQNR
ncbi:MAG: M14 family metallopeptidase [Phototrophicaceae bacterium]